MYKSIFKSFYLELLIIVLDLLLHMLQNIFLPVVSQGCRLFHIIFYTFSSFYDKIIEM